MREKIIKLYKFDELSDEAKERARNWYREGNEFGWFGECHDSIKAFEKALPIKIRDYELGGYRPSSVSFSVTDDNVVELKGLRLRTWLINHFWNDLEEGKYYIGANGRTVSLDAKHRRSNATKEVSCPFTGVCYDENLLDPIRDFIFKFTPRQAETTLKELLEDCFSSLQKAIEDEIEYQNEDEQVDESIRANEYEFYENGERA